MCIRDRCRDVYNTADGKTDQDTKSQLEKGHDTKPRDKDIKIHCKFNEDIDLQCALNLQQHHQNEKLAYGVDSARWGCGSPQHKSDLTEVQCTTYVH